MTKLNRTPGNWTPVINYNSEGRVKFAGIDTQDGEASIACVELETILADDLSDPTDFNRRAIHDCRMLAAAPRLATELRRVLTQWAEKRIIGPLVFADAEAALQSAELDDFTPIEAPAHNYTIVLSIPDVCQMEVWYKTARSMGDALTLAVGSALNLTYEAAEKWRDENVYDWRGFDGFVR